MAFQVIQYAYLAACVHKGIIFIELFHTPQVWKYVFMYVIQSHAKWTVFSTSQQSVSGGIVIPSIMGARSLIKWSYMMCLNSHTHLMTTGNVN